MSRVYNFSAAQAPCPRKCCCKPPTRCSIGAARARSVMEMSHRGNEYISIAEEAEADLRKLLGARWLSRALSARRGPLQFEMIPMNLIRGRAAADYINTGEWAKKAINAAADWPM